MQPTPDAQSALPPLDPATEVGLLGLTVADLDRALAFYTEEFGFALLERSGASAALGVGQTPLLLLSERPGAQPWPLNRQSFTGLYHFAIVVPSRADLGRWLRHWLERGHQMPGQGDHLVSEALYLADPDGNGIEIYRDRPRSVWQWDGGRVRMAVDPVDVAGVVAEGDRVGLPWGGLATGTRLGHMHLQVGDIPVAEQFYAGVLGFDVVAAMPSALFVSAGGYHHHIGMNTWHSRNASPAPEGTAGLRFFTVHLPDAQARADLVRRVRAAGHAVHEADGLVWLHDPWQNTLLLRAGAETPAGALSLLQAVPVAAR